MQLDWSKMSIRIPARKDWELNILPWKTDYKRKEWENMTRTFGITYTKKKQEKIIFQLKSCLWEKATLSHRMERLWIDIRKVFSKGRMSAWTKHLAADQELITQFSWNVKMYRIGVI